MSIRSLVLILCLLFCLPALATVPMAEISDPPQRTNKTVKDKQQDQARKQNKSRQQPPADKPGHKPVNQRQKGDKKQKEPDLQG